MIIDTWAEYEGGPFSLLARLVLGFFVEIVLAAERTGLVSLAVSSEKETRKASKAVEVAVVADRDDDTTALTSLARDKREIIIIIRENI